MFGRLLGIAKTVGRGGLQRAAPGVPRFVASSLAPAGASESRQMKDLDTLRRELEMTRAELTPCERALEKQRRCFSRSELIRKRRRDSCRWVTSFRQCRGSPTFARASHIFDRRRHVRARSTCPSPSAHAAGRPAYDPPWARSATASITPCAKAPSRRSNASCWTAGASKPRPKRRCLRTDARFRQTETYWWSRE